MEPKIVDCDKKHYEISYDESEYYYCPLCEAMNKITELQIMVQELDKE